jgi:hypothetical protein
LFNSESAPFSFPTQTWQAVCPPSCIAAAGTIASLTIMRAEREAPFEMVREADLAESGAASAHVDLWRRSAAGGAFRIARL